MPEAEASKIAEAEMLFRRSPATIVQGQSSPVPLSRVSVEPTMADELRREYIETAKGVGVINAPVRREMLFALLKEMGLSIYPYDKVAAYLDHMFGLDLNGNQTWGWRPLREEDDKPKFGTLPYGPRFNGMVLRETYQKAVPLPVLLTVQRIAEAVPGVHFFVSDQVTARDRLDPFLAVSVGDTSEFFLSDQLGTGMNIIERWDEPSFKP